MTTCHHHSVSAPSCPTTTSATNNAQQQQYPTQHTNHRNWQYQDQYHNSQPPQQPQYQHHFQQQQQSQQWQQHGCIYNDHYNQPAVVPQSTGFAPNVCRVAVSPKSTGESRGYRNDPYRFRPVAPGDSWTPDEHLTETTDEATLSASMSSCDSPPSHDTSSVESLGLLRASGTSAAAAPHASSPLPAVQRAEGGVAGGADGGVPGDAFAQYRWLRLEVAPATVHRRHGMSVVAMVVFKNREGVFLLPETAAGCEFAPGDHVIIMSDRGQHIGCIAAFGLLKQFTGRCTVGQIVRHATRHEVVRLLSMRPLELAYTEECQLAAARCGVPMRVVDTEIQLDMHRMTVFYTTPDNSSVDFRELQRLLFRVFRCRIWFANVVA